MNIKSKMVSVNPDNTTDEVTSSLKSVPKIGKGTKIYGGVIISNLTTIGKNCKISDFVMIGANSILKDKVRIGFRTKIFQNCVIGNNTIIEKGCIIKPGISIGDNCLIESNSKIENSIPDNTKVGANRILKYV